MSLETAAKAWKSRTSRHLLLRLLLLAAQANPSGLPGGAGLGPAGLQQLGGSAGAHTQDLVHRLPGPLVQADHHRLPGPWRPTDRLTQAVCVCV